jgi:hypothetical protein
MKKLPQKDWQIKDKLKNHQIRKNLVRAFELLQKLPGDFYEQQRIDTPPQKRNAHG